MINKLHHAVATCTVALLACIGAGCASYGESSTGRWTVLDPTTNPPTRLEGVKLLFAYRGVESAIVDATVICDYAAVRETDSTGSFEWPEPRMSRWTNFAAYKRGYAYPFPYDNIDPKTKTIYLAQSTDHKTIITQFKHVYWVSECGSPGKTFVLIDQFLGEAISDLKGIAVTPSDLELLGLMEKRQELSRP